MIQENKDLKRALKDKDLQLALSVNKFMQERARLEKVEKDYDELQQLMQKQRMREAQLAQSQRQLNIPQPIKTRRELYKSVYT